MLMRAQPFSLALRFALWKARARELAKGLLGRSREMLPGRANDLLVTVSTAVRDHRNVA